MELLLDDRVIQRMENLGAKHMVRRQWPHPKLEFWCRLIARKLARTFRWHSFYTQEPESIVEHMLKQVLTGKMMSSIELTLGNSGLTAEDCCFVTDQLSTHDLSESEEHDHPRTLKDDPAIGPMLKMMEEKKFKEVLSFLPPETQEYIRTGLHAVEDLTTIRGQFFDAIEWIGYFLYAFEESTRIGNKAFLSVVIRSVRELKARGYVDKFVSVRAILDAHAEKVFEAFKRHGLTVSDI